MALTNNNSAEHAFIPITTATDVMATAVTAMLCALGEDPEREGLRQTPERVTKALTYLTSGNTLSVSDVLNGVIFTERYDQMVVVKDIAFYSIEVSPRLCRGTPSV